MGNGDFIPTTGRLVVTTCWCGIQHAMPQETYAWANESGRNKTYCPLGHAGVYSESAAQKLEKAEARQRHLEDQLKAAEREAEATRVRMLKDRRRFANGVCPCCNRSFENVARHMKTEHPGYDPAVVQRPEYKCSCGRSFETMHGLRVHQGKSRPDDWPDPKKGNYWRHLTVVAR